MTDKMLSILMVVYSFPHQYRVLRKKEFKKAYIKHLKTDECALNTFLLLMGDKTIEEVSDETVSCYNLLVKTCG